jgi:pimeloyl-ACP methyl ester carboxylesterase
MPYVSTDDGTRLFYRDWGTGHAILFLASAYVSSDVWNYTLPFFVDNGFRCIAYDRRGHGRSDEPGTGYDLDSLADDVEAVVEHLGLREFAVVGHSLGGAEAVRFIARHRDRTATRLVLLAPTAPSMLRTPQNPDGIPADALAAARAAWLADFPQWVAENTRAFFASATSEALMRWGAALMTQTQLNVLLRIAETTSRSDVTSDLRQLELPTLLLHGDADASVPIAFGERAAALIPDSTFRPVANAGHGLFITHAAEVNQEILQFFRA